MGGGPFNLMAGDCSLPLPNPRAPPSCGESGAWVEGAIAPFGGPLPDRFAVTRGRRPLVKLLQPNLVPRKSDGGIQGS